LLSVSSDFRLIFQEHLACSKKKSGTFQRKFLSPVSHHAKLLELVKIMCRPDPNSSSITGNCYIGVTGTRERVFRQEKPQGMFQGTGEDEAAARAPLPPCLPTSAPSPSPGRKSCSCRGTGTAARRHTGLCGQAKARKEIPRRTEIGKECQASRKDPLQREALRKTLKLLLSTRALIHCKVNSCPFIDRKVRLSTIRCSSTTQRSSAVPFRGRCSACLSSSGRGKRQAQVTIKTLFKDKIAS